MARRPVMLYRTRGIGGPMFKQHAFSKTLSKAGRNYQDSPVAAANQVTYEGEQVTYNGANVTYAGAI